MFSIGKFPSFHMVLSFILPNIIICHESVPHIILQYTQRVYTSFNILSSNDTDRHMIAGCLTELHKRFINGIKLVVCSVILNLQYFPFHAEKIYSKNGFASNVTNFI